MIDCREINHVSTSGLAESGCYPGVRRLHRPDPPHQRQHPLLVQGQVRADAAGATDGPPLGRHQQAEHGRARRDAHRRTLPLQQGRLEAGPGASQQTVHGRR